MHYTIQELEVWYILPAIRKELAIAIKKKGLTQAKVAVLLGVTEAAVSQYIKSKRANQIKLSKQFKVEVERAAEVIIKKKSQKAEIQRLIKLAEKEFVVCTMCKDKCHSGKVCFC
ncbi:MAG: helix-turn-helix domain-containing protein [Nanoarchaeota archaeon]